MTGQEQDLLPTFRLDDLISAYTLFVSKDIAERRANEWWDFFADQVDSNGYLLTDKDMWRSDDDADDEDALWGVVLRCDGELSTGGYEVLGKMDEEDRGRQLSQMGFTHFHLNLVAYASPTVAVNVGALIGEAEVSTGMRQIELILATIEKRGSQN